VHYFTDVVGGYAAGAVWLALTIVAVEAARERFLASLGGHSRRRTA
jgi:membrane-associated phospholipid phosphatase